MSRQDKLEHIDKLTSLLEKQKLMYTRISLSKDPEAIELKEHLEQSVQLLGFPEGTDMSLLFSGMSNTIDNLKTQLDSKNLSDIIQLSNVSNLSEVSKCLLKT